MSRQANRSGFTLIEMMIVLCIIGILAAVAIPAYEKYIQKTRRSEGQTALMELYLAENEYYQDNYVYTTLAALYPGDATGESSYDNMDYYDITLLPSAPTSYFTLTATATNAQVEDTVCATLSINQLGTKSAKDSDGNAADLSTCWGE